MSVSCDTYLMFGIKIPEYTAEISDKLNDTEWEKWEPFLNGTDPIQIVGDAMSSEYVMIGVILAKVNEYYEGVDSPLSISLACNEHKIFYKMEEIVKVASELSGTNYRIGDCDIYFFTHFG